MTDWSAEWEATITPGWRGVWYIAPHKGLIGMSADYLALGSYARAEREAHRILARLRRDDERVANARTVR